MPDYKNGKIYAIRSHQTEQIYIGSTTQSLSIRFAEHKRDIKNRVGKRQPCSSKEILQYPDAYIELIEEYPCDNKEQLNKKEGEHIRSNNCVNKYIAGQTDKEYRDINREKMIEYQKEYYKQNKILILEQKKEYYKRKITPSSS